MSGSGIDILSIKTPLPDTSFVPAALSAQEQMSRPFMYNVQLSSGTGFLDPTSLIDQKVTVTLGNPATVGRYFNGIVQAVKQMPTANQKLWSYQLTVVPKLWFLEQTRNSRFFQNMTVPNIVTAILDKFSVTYSNLLQETYSTRDYTVMFNESYLHFIQRILEDEGIFYFFQHTENSHTMVLGDRKSAFDKISSPDLTVRDGAQASYDLATWSRQDGSALGKVVVDDYDPATNALTPGVTRGSAPTILTPSGAPNREHYTWPAVRGTNADAAARAKWRMEAAEAAAQIYTGTGGAMDFYAGGSFSVGNDPVKGGDAANYVLQMVSYEVTDGANGSGAGHSVVAMSCTAFPLETQWREEPAFAAPVMAGFYTAKVIGPAGEEIYVDDLGRIKVWFPWDYESDITSDDTLWLRVMQPWGGAGWGHQFIPRIGMEVVVAFLEGDVNRPVVIGSIYNSQNAPLFAPADKNKSGLRTRSTPNGGDANYHELSFDDTKGSEVMLLHAEKDYQLKVENDQTLTIDNDRNVTVTKDETVEINGKQTMKVKGDRTLTVTEGNMATSVSQGSHTLTVDTGDHSMKVSQGNHATEVSMGNVSTKISMGNLDTKLPMGNESLSVDLGSITHEAMQSITLKVGGNSIVIDPTGITLKGIMIQITGNAMAKVAAPIVQVNADGVLMMSGAITMIN